MEYIHTLSEQNKLGIPKNHFHKIKQIQFEEKREAAKKRREEEDIKRQKLKYWHLIKRDVLKHKRMLAHEDARERYEQSQRMAKWLHYIHLFEIMKTIFGKFQANREEHDRAEKQWTIVS